MGLESGSHIIGFNNAKHSTRTLAISIKKDGKNSFEYNRIIKINKIRVNFLQENQSKLQVKYVIRVKKSCTIPLSISINPSKIHQCKVQVSREMSPSNPKIMSKSKTMD